MPRQAKRPAAAGAGKAGNRSTDRQTDAWDCGRLGNEGAGRSGGNARHPRADTERAAPGSAAEALARAREHGRVAASEAIAAVRALLDAASLGASGQPCEAHAGTAALARSLDELSASLAGRGRGRPSAITDAILDALDDEIRRWEVRSVGDAEARAVLRAFLGLREILWEFGLSRSDPDRSGTRGGRPAAAPGPSRERREKEGGETRQPTDPNPRARGPRRVQRVKVQN